MPLVAIIYTSNRFLIKKKGRIENRDNDVSRTVVAVRDSRQTHLQLHQGGLFSWGKAGRGRYRDRRPCKDT